jgi:hypothetical protein
LAIKSGGARPLNGIRPEETKILKLPKTTPAHWKFQVIAILSLAGPEEEEYPRAPGVALRRHHPDPRSSKRVSSLPSPPRPVRKERNHVEHADVGDDHHTVI